MDIRRLLRSFFTQHPEIVVAYLFGSQARGDALPTSDIDIAVWPGNMA